MILRLEMRWWGTRYRWARYRAWRQHVGRHRDGSGRPVGDTIRIARLRARTRPLRAWQGRARVSYPLAWYQPA